MTTDVDVWELQIHDECGPDLSFECGTREECERILRDEYGPRATLAHVIIDPDGRIVESTR